MFKNKYAQIWVETVIYTLIGLTIIAILLSVAVPQIQKMKDKSVITQTIEALNILNSKVLETADQSPGNIRIVDFKISQGKLEIKSEGDTIIYTLEDTKLELSEPGKEIKEGDITLRTEKYGARYNIILKIDYSGKLDLTNDMGNQDKVLQAGTTPYKIKIENIGDNAPNAKVHIDFGVV